MKPGSTIAELNARYGPRYRWILMGSVMVGAMASIMSSTIINVAIPGLSHQFHLGQERAQWVSSGFMVAMTIAMLTTPWLLSRFGYRDTYLGTMVLLMAPSTPYVAEELWEQLGEPYSVHTQEWPTFDESLAKDDFVEMVIQINGKLRDKIVLPAGTSEEAAKAAVRSSEKIAVALDNVQILKEIYVPGRLMNFVVKPQ